jgi:hypothetical protein
MVVVAGLKKIVARQIIAGNDSWERAHVALMGNIVRSGSWVTGLLPRIGQFRVGSDLSSPEAATARSGAGDV